MPPWRRRPDADFAAEIEAHLALEADAIAREGVPAEEASALARKTFGNVAATQERFYDSQRAAWLDRIKHDLVGAVRQFRRFPAFTAVATLTLALGIGLSAAVFSVANAVLIRRLPVTDQNRLVLLSGESVDGKSSKIPLTLDGVRALQRRSRSIESSAFYSFRGAVPAPIRFGDTSFPIRLGLVSGNMFNVLGSVAEAGRALRPDDDVSGAAPVVVLSHRAWQRDFNGDKAIVGKSVTMIYTNRSYTIVGVMPLGLDLPRGTDIWAPLVAYGSAGGFLDALAGELNVLVRLKRNASASQVRAELTDFLAEADFPGSRRGARGAAELLSTALAGELRPALELVSVIASLFLVITCVNVANLLLVRALSRERELMLRSALGADRGRLMSQLLAESCVLSIMGGIAGVALASFAIRVFVLVSPANAPRLDEIHMDSATLVIAILLTSVATLMFGLGPALLTSRSVDHGSPPTASRHTHGRQSRTVAEVLVIAQIALAVTTLASAAVVTRSLMKLERIDLSFDPHHLTVASLAMSADRIPDAHAPREALDGLVENIGALPGVRAVTPVATIPFVGDGGGIDNRMSVVGQSSEERVLNPIEDLEVAAPNYFSTLGIPLLRGRAFSSQDRSGSPRVIIVSRAVAEHFWPGVDPIGKRLSDSHDDFTIVGEVPDTRYRDIQSARPTVYFPIDQWQGVPLMVLIRTDSSIADMSSVLRRTIANAKLGVTLISATSVATLLDSPRAQPRLNAMVFMFFAIAAILLATIGLYAIVSVMVRQRTREFGIRLALGATPKLVGRAVLVRGVRLGLIGTAIGIVGAISASRLVSALLFDVSAVDAVSLSVVAALMVTTTAIASLIPARLGMRVSPVAALRREN